MAQYHHVIYFDTADEQWHVDPQTDAYMPDGEVFDYAGDQEWSALPDAERDEYVAQIPYILGQLNYPEG